MENRVKAGFELVYCLELDLIMLKYFLVALQILIQKQVHLLNHVFHLHLSLKFHHQAEISL